MYEIHVVNEGESRRLLFKTNFADGFCVPEPIGGVSSRDCEDLDVVSEPGDTGYLNDAGMVRWQGTYDGRGLSFEAEPDENPFVTALGRALKPFEGGEMPASVYVYDSMGEMEHECAGFAVEEG